MTIYTRDPSTLLVSEVSAASPEMTDDAFHEFVASIKTHGQQVPILVSGDHVYDGRKRVQACLELGIAVSVIDLDPNQEPLALARALNILRTHYTPSQRALFAEQMATMTAADGHKVRAGSSRPNLDGIKKSMKTAASEMGVSRSAVAFARVVRKAVPPEIVAQVEAGRLSLHAAKYMRAPRPSRALPVSSRRKTGGRPRDNKKYAAALPMLEQATSVLRWAGAETPVGKYKRSIIKTADRVHRIVRLMRTERGEGHHGEKEKQAL